MTVIPVQSPYATPARRPQASAAAPVRMPPLREERCTSALSLTIAFGSAALLAAMLAGGLSQLIAAIYVTVVLLILAVLKPQVCIMATFVFLAMMGDFRRLLIDDVSAHFDPVLLIGPATAGVLFILAFCRGRLRRTTKISKLVIALMLIMVLQIFNPLQGGIAVGIAGALFYLVPLLWFWIGQAWGSRRLLELVIFRVVVPIGVIAAVLGLRQALYGLYPFEMAAMAKLSRGSVILSGSTVRPFAFFTSTAEFTQYLSLAIAVLMASLFARRIRMVLLAVPILVLSLFLSGVRGPVVASIGTCVVLWAMLSRNPKVWAFRVCIAAAIAIVGMVWALDQVKSSESEASGPVASLMKHQTDGLLDAGNSRKSTAGIHAQLLAQGFARGLLNPIGQGLGSTTLAAAKFGGVGAGTEMDISDSFLSLGLVGGLLYLTLVLAIFHRSITWWRTARPALALALLGVLIVLLGHWLQGGEYSIAAIVCFCVGGLDRTVRCEAPHL